MEWFRTYHDMHLDPKWRLVAMDAGAKVKDVIAVWMAMMNRASKSEPRGSINGWNDRVEGAALDMTGDEVRAIREAMQGLTLDGDRLTGWEKRQPKREDGSSERSKAWREARRTQANASERAGTLEEKRGEETREEPKNDNNHEDGAAAPQPSRYEFEGRVIKLTPADFAKWRSSYTAIDLRSHLQRRDDWLSTECPAGDRHKWFLTTSNWLAEKNEKAAAEKAKPPKPKITPLGVGG